jgi:hypothetical protein
MLGLPLVDEKKQAVLILNIFYGGRDYEALMSESYKDYAE